MSIFDVPLNRQGLSTMKWEAELARTNDPELLCSGTADMDFRSPEPILETIREIAGRGHLGYPYVTKEYYGAIENWLYRLCGWKIDASSCVENNVGIYTAVWCVLDALTKPGDEVIIQQPVHFCFNRMLVDNGRTPVVNPLHFDGERYTMDFEQLESCFTERTKLFWLCNPHNPVGRAWTREELEKIADICLKHNVPILSDDVYCEMLFPGKSYIPIAAVSPEAAQNTIICYSTSKAYNTTSVKHSFVVSENRELLDQYYRSLTKLDLEYGLNLIGMEVTKTAFNKCGDWVRELMEYIEGNYRVFDEILCTKTKTIRTVQPEATYFVWVDMRGLKLGEKPLSDVIEKEAHLLIGMGDKLGIGGDGFIRVNLGCTRDMVSQIANRLVQIAERYE